MAYEWLTAEQAAARLGVKRETVYAYVSRGLLRREPTPGHRQSRYLRAEVERLAARQRSGGRAGGLEVIVETEVTHLDPSGNLSYRGWEATDAARTATFEEIAGWLWTGERQPAAFDAPARQVTAARRAVRALREAPAIDQMRAAVVAMRTVDPLRDDRRAPAVARAGGTIMGTLLGSLRTVGQAPPQGTSAAQRLWPVLTATRATPKATRLLDMTLILLADHELAASTFAARVAASTWADPYLVVEAGLAVLGGPLHGGASESARAMLRDVKDHGVSPEEAVGSQLRSGSGIGGFGHSLYAEGDPRAAVLLESLLALRSPTTSAADRLLAVTSARQLPPANVDFALGVLAETYNMTAGAGEVIFATARIVGWLAHAAEEYQHRLRFRPRAVYTGAVRDQARAPG